MKTFIINRYLLLIIVLGCQPFSGISQAVTPDKLTESFFLKYESNPAEALDYIFSTNKWMAVNAEAVDNLKKQLIDLAALVGEYYGFEKIAEKRLGNSLMIQIYMIKYDRQPLRFVFKYYKPQDNWVIHNFCFDDKIDEDLEEEMKELYLGGK